MAMALEIERRFLVSGSAWRSHGRWRRHLRQGYLLESAADLTVRVRGQDPDPLQQRGAEASAAWLTLKARPPLAGDGGSCPSLPDGLIRLEYEYPIPPADLEALLLLCGPRRLEKWRYGLDLPDGDWVVDVYEGANAPLVVAEVELASADQAVTVPAWCGRELTGLPQLSNAALALRPLAQWSQPERQALLGAAGFSAADAWDPFPPESSS